jgi:hypothetical protein
MHCMCGADRSCVIVACVVAVAYKTVSVCRLPNERSRATFRKSVARRQPPIFHRNDSRPPTNDTSLHAAAGAARTRMERSKDDLARLVGSLLAPPELRRACATQMPVFANGSSVGDWSVLLRRSPPLVERRDLSRSLPGGLNRNRRAVAARGRSCLRGLHRPRL